MHVRITNKGREVLNNKSLSNLVVETISQNRAKLDNGEKVVVGRSNLTITLSTSMKDKSNSVRQVKE